MKVLMGHHGLRGDLALNLPAIEWLHRSAGGDIQIDMPIHRQFADMLPLFANHPALNACIITDEYEHFPSAKDKETLCARRYDKVFSPMAPHRIDRWHDHMHQTAAVLFDYIGAELPEDQQQINLVKWFDIPDHGKTIALAPYAGFYNPNNQKKLSITRAQELVNLIISKGFKVLQLGGPTEPKLKGTEFPKTDYFDAVRDFLGCRLLLHTDTGFGWVASGYKFTQIGLYSSSYYGEDKVKNIQPRNPNGKYLSSANVNEISLDLIAQTLDDMIS